MKGLCFFEYYILLLKYDVEHSYISKGLILYQKNYLHSQEIKDYFYLRNLIYIQNNLNSFKTIDERFPQCFWQNMRCI
jgi:hypothetical protein